MFHGESVIYKDTKQNMLTIVNVLVLDFGLS